jgi:putative PIN family toxin of toxin-antitoxin system
VRVLLDTNVLIAAFISSRGRCAEILEHCAEAHELVSSPALLEEYREKLVTKFRLVEETAAARMELLRSQMEIVSPAGLPIPVCRDPDDDDVLAAAQTGRCHCIITGDQDLLVLERYEGIVIVAPGDFAAFESTMQF